MTKTRDQRGEDTRQRLMAAAVEMIGARGWDAVTTRQIAARAGVNQALINYHFGTREALLRAAAGAILRDAFTAPLQAMLAAPTLAEGMASLVMAMDAFDASDPAVRFGVEALSRATRDPDMAAEVAGLLAEVRTSLAERIGAGRLNEELPAELDPTGAAIVLGALVDGIGLHYMVDPTLELARAADAVRVLLSTRKEDR